MLLVMGTSFE